MMMPAKDRELRNARKRLGLYKSGQAYYEEVPVLKDDGRGAQSG